MSGEKFPIQVLQSWGIASARHTSGSTVPSRTKDTEFLFDAPLGPSIVRWDVSTQQRLRQFQAHQDLVTCMRRYGVHVSCDRFQAHQDLVTCMRRYGVHASCDSLAR